MTYGHRESAWIMENIDEEKCSPWERNFLQSLSEQAGKNRSLSEKQRAVLGRMWDQHGEGSPGKLDIPEPITRPSPILPDDEIPF